MPMFSAQRSKSIDGIALTQNTARISSAATVTMTETRNDNSTPNRLSNRNTMYEAAHHAGCHSAGVFEDRGHVRADEEHDDRGSEDVLDALREPGEHSTPGTHRAAREGVCGAGVRQRGRHLGKTEDQAPVHRGDDEQRDQHRAEAVRRVRNSSPNSGRRSRRRRRVPTATRLLRSASGHASRNSRRRPACS